MTHRLSTNCAKNYCNRTLIVKVIADNVVTCFFGTRCIICARMTVAKFGRDMGLSYAKEIVSIYIFCCLSTMHERERETDRQTDHRTITSIPIGEISFSDVAYNALLCCYIFHLNQILQCHCWICGLNHFL